MFRISTRILPGLIFLIAHTAVGEESGGGAFGAPPALGIQALNVTALTDAYQFLDVEVGKSLTLDGFYYYIYGTPGFFANIVSLQFQSPSDFQVVNDGCTGRRLVIPPSGENQYCYFSVKFTPSSGGQKVSDLLMTWYIPSLMVDRWTFVGQGIEKYKLQVTVNGSVASDDQNTFRLAPTILSRSGCSTGYAPSQIPVKIECVDTQSGELVEGCRYKTDLALGNDDGGHAHASPSRPLACASSECPNIQDRLVSGQEGDIPKEGKTLAYLAPEVAGEVVLKVSGENPNGGTFQTMSSNLQIRIDKDLQPMFINGLNIVTDSHPGLGLYGVPDFKNKLEKAVLLYLVHWFDQGIPNPTPLRSEGASLPWGGLFDINRNWRPSHCGHRMGDAIDLSHLHLKRAEKKVFARVVEQAGLQFYQPESPSSDANHWHAFLPIGTNR